MERTSISNNTRKYALAGVSFGLLFPILATLIRILESDLPLSIPSIVAVQSTDALLWIIDLAPVFLSIFATFAGRRQDALELSNDLLRHREEELKTAHTALEAGMAERNQELTSLSRQLGERAAQLNNTTDAMRILLTVQDLDRLLMTIAGTISRHFDYDYVGVYLLDEQKQYAMLLATKYPDGQNTIQPGYRLKVGNPSLVDLAIRSGQAQYNSEVGTDPRFESRPGLAETRSEMVLPLRFGELIMGAIDLQSNAIKDFTAEYVSLLSILADFLAIAIQNASRHEKTRRTIRELETSSKKISATEWSGWMEAVRIRGYRYDGIRAEPMKESATPAAEEQGLSIPLHLRGRLIGNLRIKSSDASPALTDDDRAIAEATAERAAIALEGARLLDEAQKRAVRESFLSDIAARLSTSFQLDSILRDTVEELGQTLKGSSITFQLVSPSKLPPADNAETDGSKLDRKSSR